MTAPTLDKPMMKCGHVANATCNKLAGVEYAPPIPCCVICDCVETVERPSLDGRISRCDCKMEAPSSWQLAFFEYRGPGSRAALESCKGCGYLEVAHANPRPAHLRRTVCQTFEPHGAYDYDRHYCGCRGWD